MTKRQKNNVHQELIRSIEEGLACAKATSFTADGPLSSLRLKIAHAHLNALDTVDFHAFLFRNRLSLSELQTKVMDAITLWVMALERHNELHASCILYDCSTGEPRKEDRITRKSLYWC